MGIKHLCRQTIIKYQVPYSPHNITARLRYRLLPFCADCFLTTPTKRQHTHTHTPVCQLDSLFFFPWLEIIFSYWRKYCYTTTCIFPNTSSILEEMTGDVYSLCVFLSLIIRRHRILVKTQLYFLTDCLPRKTEVWMKKVNSGGR